MKAASALESTWQRCRLRLEKDGLGQTLWAYLCVALFLIALTVSMLGCAGAPLAPQVEGTMMRTGAPPPAEGAGDAMSTALGANPIAGLTVRF
jgi:hypothetical protein